MARIRLTLRLFLALSLTFLVLGGSLVSAQRPGSSQKDNEDESEGYVSELTDLEITFSDDWELDESEVFDDEPMQENVYLLSDAGFLTLSFNEIGDVDPGDFLADYLDVLAGDDPTFELIDEDSSRGFGWAVFESELEDGTPLIGYVDVDDSFSDDFFLMTMIVAEDVDILDQYELANETVEVGGDEILGEFDVDELDEIISGVGSAPDDDEDQDEDVDAESTPDDGNHSETGDEGRASRSSGDDSYAFESVDLELTVNGDVEIDDVEFEEDAYEQVLLLGFGSIGQVIVFEDPGDPEDILLEYLDIFAADMDAGEEIDSGVDGGVAWALYEISIGNTDFYVYATLDDSRLDGMNYLELIAAPVDIFEDEFVVFQESVEIDGDPMFADIDIDDLVDVIG